MLMILKLRWILDMKIFDRTSLETASFAFCSWWSSPEADISVYRGTRVNMQETPGLVYAQW